MSTVNDLLIFLQQFAPPRLAVEWDNVGLLLGDPAANVERVMTCLTVTPTSAQEAIDGKAQLIVSHHPILFRAAKRLTTTTPEGRMLWSSPAPAWRCTVRTLHSITRSAVSTIFWPVGSVCKPWDRCATRTASASARWSSSCRTRTWEKLPTPCSRRRGPDWPVQPVQFSAGGDRDVFGSEAANPTVGQKGRREEVSEWRLEALCPESAVGRVIAAMRSAHSYEEPAYDVYPLRPEPSKTGQGRIGRLSQPVALAALARTVGAVLKTGHVQFVGDPERLVQKVAIVCGAGGEFVTDAVAREADVLLTGEARFHDCLAAEAHGLTLVLPGHYASERCGVEELAEQIKKEFPGLEVWPSRRERDPVQGVTGP